MFKVILKVIIQRDKCNNISKYSYNYNISVVTSIEPVPTSQDIIYSALSTCGMRKETPYRQDMLTTKHISKEKLCEHFAHYYVKWNIQHPQYI